jgi:putative transposase
MGESIKELMIECAKKHLFSIIEMECDKDHIHLLVNYSPKQSVTSIVARLN